MCACNEVGVPGYELDVVKENAYELKSYINLKMMLSALFQECYNGPWVVSTKCPADYGGSWLEVSTVGAPAQVHDIHVS